MGETRGKPEANSQECWIGWGHTCPCLKTRIPRSHHSSPNFVAVAADGGVASAVAERWRRWGLLFEFVDWETDTNDDCLGHCCSQPDCFDWDGTAREK